jgi:hypothetical protein
VTKSNKYQRTEQRNQMSTYGLTFTPGMRLLINFAATTHLGWPTSALLYGEGDVRKKKMQFRSFRSHRKRNWRFKLETSMVSISMTSMFRKPTSAKSWIMKGVSRCSTSSHIFYFQELTAETTSANNQDSRIFTKKLENLEHEVEVLAFRRKSSYDFSVVCSEINWKGN